MNIPLLEESDIQILMHRDVHFGGNFQVMIDYYEAGGVGVQENFEIERIKELYQFEKSLNENLSEKLLPMPMQEEVARAKKLYLQLRDVYESAGKTALAHLISDLILSEENPPLEEIDALAMAGREAVAPLCQLVNSPTFYDTLYPGYGLSPLHAAKALAEIGDPVAISHLFSAHLRQEDLDHEEALASALLSFGGLARTFLLKRLVEKPYSHENEHAAMILASFLPDNEIEETAMRLLSNKEVLKKERFVTYLLYLLSETSNPEAQALLKRLSQKKELSQDLVSECLQLLKINKN